MIVVEVVGVAVLLVLVLAATWMAVVGLLGAIGAIHLRRCRSCGHLIASGTPRAPSVCPYCRHPRLLGHLIPVHLHHFLPQEMTPAETSTLDASKPTAH